MKINQVKITELKYANELKISPSMIYTNGAGKVGYALHDETDMLHSDNLILTPEQSKAYIDAEIKEDYILSLLPYTKDETTDIIE